MAAAAGPVATPLWITGPANSGKSTLALQVARIAYREPREVRADATITAIRYAMTQGPSGVLVLEDTPGVSASRLDEVARRHIDSLLFASTMRSGQVVSQQPSPRRALIVSGPTPLAAASVAARVVELDLGLHPVRRATDPRDAAGSFLAGAAERAAIASAVSEWVNGPEATNPLIAPALGCADPAVTFARTEILNGWVALLGFLTFTEVITLEDGQKFLDRAAATLSDLPAPRTAPARRGRPTAGEQVMTRIPTQQLLDLDAFCETHGLTRAEAVRKAVDLLINSPSR